ncbi:hypothetical protein [Sulfitobacter sp. JB4-11]|uniref:hypothetical protein n=1 Tax=Sulfitobacter rhodophyticola TaxID=3238304 RepID=UPI003510F2EB
MLHFGNVVPLPERQNAVPSRIPPHRRIDVGLLSPLERSYCTIPFSEIKVSQGVMHGELLEHCDDFMVGDTFVVNTDSSALASNDHTHSPKPANAVQVDCPTIIALASFADVVRMTMLDDTGCGYQAYAVAPTHAGMRAPYVLLPRALPVGRKLTLIKAVSL